MTYPFDLTLNITDERQAAALFAWALEHGYTSYLTMLRGAVPKAWQWGTSINDLNFGVGVWTILHHNGKRHVCQLIVMKPSKILALGWRRWTMTPGMLEEIRQELAKLGQALQEDE